MSHEKTDAKRRNATKSTEPRTDRGKRDSAKNALRFGFFTREIVVKAEEQSEFETLRVSLRRQFTPATAMQKIGSSKSFVLAGGASSPCVWRRARWAVI